jgi:GMP synthase-like glutamine amidotransferase
VSPKVIILSGGPNSVHVEGSPRVPPGFWDYCAANSIPVLGICYGMQLIVQMLGGEVGGGSGGRAGQLQGVMTSAGLVVKSRSLPQAARRPAPARPHRSHPPRCGSSAPQVTPGEVGGEYGRMPIIIQPGSTLYADRPAGSPERPHVWMSHGDEAARLPAGFKCVARSEQGAVVAIEDPARKIYGLQVRGAAGGGAEAGGGRGRRARGQGAAGAAAAGGASPAIPLPFSRPPPTLPRAAVPPRGDAHRGRHRDHPPLPARREGGRAGRWGQRGKERGARRQPVVGR